MEKKNLALIFIFVLALLSCNNNDELETPTIEADLLKSATIAVNDLAVESVSQEASYEADFYAEYEHLLRSLAHFKGKKSNLLAGRSDLHYDKGQAPVVSIDTAATGYPITISIDYGTGITLNHGRVVSGQVKIEISADKNTDGSTRLITFSNCVIDSIGINGTSKETFNGNNTSSRKMTHTSEVTFILQDGTKLERTGNNIREWLSGVDTPTDRTDDRIQTSGTVQVKSSAGDNYSRVITVPLIHLGDCRHHVQGIIEYSQNGLVIAKLDYGDGTCDDVATLTSNGTTVEIELKDRMPKANIKGMGERKKSNSGGN